MSSNRLDLLDPLPEYSAVVSDGPRGWHYVVHRGSRFTNATVAELNACRFGRVETKEQAWACALAALRGLMSLDRLVGR